MDATPQRFAYHCLPLVMANQFGWELLCPTNVSASWNGDAGPAAVSLRFDGAPSASIASHFGSGIITFFPGYIFRTPPEFDLLVTGPANYIKAGACPLEGLVETGWSPYTFTMNWKITQHQSEIRFEKGEPIARILPLPHNYLGTFEPHIMPLDANGELSTQFSAWVRRRATFARSLADLARDDALKHWTRDYFEGLDQGGKVAQDHLTRLDLKEFKAI
jgi:hypothetical protein